MRGRFGSARERRIVTKTKKNSNNNKKGKYTFKLFPPLLLPRGVCLKLKFANLLNEYILRFSNTVQQYKYLYAYIRISRRRYVLLYYYFDDRLLLILVSRASGFVSVPSRAEETMWYRVLIKIFILCFVLYTTLYYVTAVFVWSGFHSLCSRILYNMLSS